MTLAQERCSICEEGSLTVVFTGRLFLKVCSHCKGEYGDDETSKFNVALSRRPATSKVVTAPTLSDLCALGEKIAEAEKIADRVDTGVLIDLFQVRAKVHSLVQSRFDHKN